jgi:hypothetical protein
MSKLRSYFLEAWIHLLRSPVSELPPTLSSKGGFAYLSQRLPSGSHDHLHDKTILLRHSIAQHIRCRNINLLPIDYAFQPRLRGRLTPGGLTFPGKPLAIGVGESHPHYRYSCRHLHFLRLQYSLRYTFLD